MRRLEPGHHTSPRRQRLHRLMLALGLTLLASPAIAAPGPDVEDPVDTDADVEVPADSDQPDDPQPARRVPHWTIQVDPLTTALGYVHLQFERSIGSYVSIYAGPSLRLFNGILDLDAEESFIGLGGELGVRCFVVGGAPKGWWVQARGVLAHLEAESGVTDIGGYVSVLGGYTAIFGGWFVLSGGLGVQYIDYTVDGLGTKTWFPAAHTTVGVAF